MSNTHTYYRSTHPVITEHIAEWARRRDAFREQCAALEAEHPGARVAVRKLPWGTFAVGLFADTCPGPLWVRKAGDQHWTPTLRSKAGKALKARLEALKLGVASTPGMPDELMDEPASTLRWHSFETLNGKHWVGWELAAEVVEADPSFDPTIWERARASEYWTAKEAAEAQEAAL